MQVNNVDVVGLGRPEVVQRLRDSTETVTLLVSRQEVVEEQQRERQDVSHHITTPCVRCVVY